MDKQEAKLILSSHTLGKEPVGDSQFDAAKALLEKDEELTEWWKDQKETDAAMSQSLRSFEVPADLHSALKMTIADKERKRLRFAKARNWFSIAAVFILGFGLFFQYGIDRSDDYTGPLAERTLNYSVDGPWLKYMDKDTSNIRNWLTSNGFSLPDTLPPKLLALEGIGCRPLDWSNEGVALMCFNADTVYHLYVAKEQDFPDFDATNEIQYATYDDGWTSKRWKDNDHILILNAKATVDEMSQFLASYTPSAKQLN